MAEHTLHLEPNLPWLPEDSFWEQNREPIGAILGTIDDRYPDLGAAQVLHDTEAAAPSLASLAWMHKNFMGKQHGTMEGPDGKMPLPRSEEYRYWPDFARIAYGDYSFTIPSRIDTKQEYTKAFVLSGTQENNIDRLLAAINRDPGYTNVGEIIMMSGQRIRGWNAPGEASPEELLAVTAQKTGTDMDVLKQLSPYVKAELAKQGEGWNASFATEYAMCRLAVEAVFIEQIDWRNYPVALTLDEQAEPLHYGPEGKYTVPARTEAMVTYTLKDGRNVHVINGKATLRGKGLPRPTSDSQTREAVGLLVPQHSREKLVIASSVPHTRAALDALIRIVAMRKSSVVRADIVTSDWEPSKELIAGLGEIPATHRADLRLRAALEDQNPDDPRYDIL